MSLDNWVSTAEKPGSQLLFVCMCMCVCVNYIMLIQGISYRFLFTYDCWLIEVHWREKRKMPLY